jgi:hypothetical protein
MMKRLLSAFIDDFGSEAGRELFEGADLGLRQAEEQAEREERAKKRRERLCVRLRRRISGG